MQGVIFVYGLSVVCVCGCVSVGVRACICRVATETARAWSCDLSLITACLPGNKEFCEMSCLDPGLVSSVVEIMGHGTWAFYNVFLVAERNPFA